MRSDRAEASSWAVNNDELLHITTSIVKPCGGNDTDLTPDKITQEIKLCQRWPDGETGEQAARNANPVWRSVSSLAGTPSRARLWLRAAPSDPGCLAALARRGSILLVFWFHSSPRPSRFPGSRLQPSSLVAKKNHRPARVNFCPLHDLRIDSSFHISLIQQRAHSAIRRLFCFCIIGTSDPRI